MSEYMQPNVVIVDIVTPDTEFAWNPPAKTKNIAFHVRANTVPLRYAFVTGKVAAPTDPYFTLPAGHIWSAPDRLTFGDDAVQIYFAAPIACVVEIEYWITP